VEVGLRPGGWYPLDVSHGPGPGFAVEHGVGKRRVWPVTLGTGLAGLGQDSGGVPWWQDALSSSIRTAQNILQARYAQAPAGTLIQTPGGGTYVRGAGASAGVYAPPLAVPAFGGISSTGLLLGAAGLVGLVLLASRSRR
jgi:hypothetical protein